LGATATVTTTFVRDVFDFEGIRIISSAGTKSRAAVATGTVTLGTERVVAPDNSSFHATIDSAVSKEKALDRPRPSAGGSSGLPQIPPNNSVRAIDRPSKTLCATKRK
jgi:hypothetical protein